MYPRGGPPPFKVAFRALRVLPVGAQGPVPPLAQVAEVYRTVGGMEYQGTRLEQGIGRFGGAGGQLCMGEEECGAQFQCCPRSLMHFYISDPRLDTGAVLLV